MDKLATSWLGRRGFDFDLGGVIAAAVLVALSGRRLWLFFLSVFAFAIFIILLWFDLRKEVG